MKDKKPSIPWADLVVMIWLVGVFFAYVLSVLLPKVKGIF